MRLKDCHVGVVGLGLIGGSIAGALKANGSCKSVFGWDNDERTLRFAEEKGFIDIAAGGLEELVAFSDVLIIATPAGEIINTGKQAYLCPNEKVKAIMDTGSAKRKVGDVLSRLWGERYVGFHPMAGKEKGGIRNASSDLFKGALCAVVPFPSTSEETISLAEELGLALGASTLKMDPLSHDRAAACLSHFPMMLSIVLPLVAEEHMKDLSHLFAMASGGFKDTSRLSSGPSWLVAQMWEQNGDLIKPLLLQAGALLERMASSSKDEAMQMAEMAKSKREKILGLTLSERGDLDG
ncbi:prephenate dehydrogenase/arogenate dehydrogenase family protein [Thermovirga sp.]|uniref:prephenate dehydrogenase n=1 Tax=Thermovirga sp. TaxID=2699834 RepID=UPI0025EA3C04|nr:prephenate dehydrogenase/arogenate dehydrogenase family protein [Thermovirga sp.]MBO8154365.1 prephenate dehydrogenase/arogenate dehydrogenase family protein [Thermovirga sp.]